MVTSINRVAAGLMRDHEGPRNDNQRSFDPDFYLLGDLISSPTAYESAAEFIGRLDVSVNLSALLSNSWLLYFCS